MPSPHSAPPSIDAPAETSRPGETHRPGWASALGRAFAARPWLWCWLAAALLAIFQHGPMPMYSTRTLSVAWEMWVRHSFAVPYLNGLPYSDKPPLLLWLIHLGWLIGGVGDVWPRLLEVALGAIQLLLVARLAERLFPEHPQVARTAPWIAAAFSFGFLFGLQVMYEVLLADCVLAALLCLTPTPQRASPRWIGFALAVGLGLLSKGPVMWLHVAFPWLLGPWWNRWARRERSRWYGTGLLALLAGSLLLLGWVALATWTGGESYRQKLVVHQTAGRVVDAFAHAAPFWWYLPLLPVLIFPFALWPRAWVALGLLRGPLDTGLRFVLAWIVPVFVAFSLISGKQPYYLLPEFGGFALLIAAALARFEHPWHARRWLGPWPLALLCAVTAVALVVLEYMARHGKVADRELATLGTWGVPFGVLFAGFAIALMVRRWRELQRIALIGLMATVAAHALFTVTLWPAYDFSPIARRLAQAEAGGSPIANLESNDGQYTFLGRLREPVTQLRGLDAVRHWSTEHPDGLVITYPRELSAADRAHAVYIQPFRGIWVAIWPVSDYVAAREHQQLRD
ncbi:glycosyltransferase family 39 protein [Dyella sp. ASV21]|uniref:ArnT family glycosyltransferase n=1 Tax=Dyella sp. ASV21 TaxID=2795114 RepID=UPI0018EB3181|nr:glycosyltransferase family 39 protein [Dyella sp. ASV21]